IRWRYAVVDAVPGRKRVLVVDDEECVRKILRRILALEGFDVETAGDGREALAAMELFEPDVLLLDLRMPNMDGPAMLRAMADRGARLPTIAVSAMDAED